MLSYTYIMLLALIEIQTHFARNVIKQVYDLIKSFISGRFCPNYKTRKAIIKGRSPPGQLHIA